MRQVGILLAAVVLAGTVGACADPYYGYRNRSYAYTSDYYYPNYYSSRPVYYSSAPVYYGQPYYYGPNYYGSRYDYYRNYNGIHSTNEVSAM
ncbi:MAG: hypothetical protein J0J01_01785 [Reyranella sp.]|uniref:hypothetical protein n=1 Tax=Reyranella sp. TaxID=1929291 RepID=UPI001AC6D19E|nr:hypothetical protein [Reyranella sp.]MBN9085613.1 hypothetical protein [Reyranella sp.]